MKCYFCKDGVFRASNHFAYISAKCQCDATWLTLEPNKPITIDNVIAYDIVQYPSHNDSLLSSKRRYGSSYVIDEVHYSINCYFELILNKEQIIDLPAMVERFQKLAIFK